MWEDLKADCRGVGIKPVYPTLVKVMGNDNVFYKLMCIVDIFIGFGGKRHEKIAEEELKKIIM